MFLNFYDYSDEGYTIVAEISAFSSISIGIKDIVYNEHWSTKIITSQVVILSLRV